MKTSKTGIILLILILSLQTIAQPVAKKGKAYLVSNAHFDTQWNWDVQKSITEYIPKTINQNLMLLEKYPNYIFNFEGGIKYAWMKEYFPQQYELIKKYIAEKRWHVTGSTWDANDPNIPSPESFTRNILYGQHFYRDEFGVEGTDIFLPDCFGFGWTLPTLAAHSGLIGFSTQKLQWRHKPFHNGSKIPFEIGLWQGVDGARIMMVADAHNYTTKWKDEDLSKSAALQKIIDKSPINTVYHYYGTGDTGGAPTIESVRAVEKGVAGNGPIEIISATSDQLYKDYLPFDKHPELPVYDGELLMDVHATGCYTSQAAMKLYNRRNELLADASERAAVMADWLGGLRYPKAVLSEAWKRVIWHQFHDDLTGTSIPRAYEFSWNDELISMKQFADVLTSSAGSVSRSLDTRVKGIPLVMYNSNAFPVSDVIEVTVKNPGSAASYVVYNEKGKQVKSQVIARSKDALSILVAVDAPSCGYVVYDLRPGKASPTQAPKATAGTLENSVYKLIVNKDGDISSIIDKRHNKELVKSDSPIRLALFTENESFSWPAWEILKKTVDNSPVSITGEVTVSIAENGPLRAALCVEKKNDKSVFKQYIRLNEGGQADRIDIYNEIDWQSTNALLKAEFPLSVSNPLATYDLGIGAIQRGNNTETAYEVYAQYWADLTDKDGSYGVSIINDSKYGWDKPTDNTLRLTLLHTPKTRGGYAYQNKQDFGKHYFSYSIIGHAGDYRKAATVAKAEIVNQPLKAFVAPKAKGELGRSFSFVENNNSNVIVKALKKAEKSDEYVIRLYETTGKQQQEVTLNFAGNIVSAEELNGVEDKIGNAVFGDNKLKFSMKPFSIKTFKVKLSESGTAVAELAATPVSLPLNLKAASYNAFRGDANLDGRGNSFAAELWPDAVRYKGVDFKLAAADEMNALKCKLQEVELPQGDFNRLYLLLASVKSDVNTELDIDGVKHAITAHGYSGFVGQWGHTDHTAGFLKPSGLAYVGTHRHNMIQNSDMPYEQTYMHVVSVDLPANAKKLTLPDDSRVVVFAASMVKDDVNRVTPAVDLMGVHLPDAAPEGESDDRNLAAGKKVIAKSGEFNQREIAECAIDDLIDTKWCDGSENNPKYIEIDLGKEETIRGWSVFHAGLEASAYITKEYSLMVKNEPEGEWKTVDTVYDNKILETNRKLPEAVKARYIRLDVAKPEQNGGGTVRIYEFSVY